MEERVFKRSLGFLALWHCPLMFVVLTGNVHLHSFVLSD